MSLSSSLWACHFLINIGSSLLDQKYNGKRLVLEGIGCRDYVQYTLRGMNEEEPYSVCKDFITENTEYIPASLLRKSLEKHPGEKEYAYFMRCCEKLNLKNL